MSEFLSFAEMFKVAAPEVVKTRGGLEQKLQPGDVLVTTNAPTHNGGIGDKVLRFGLRTVFGDAGHTAMYVGDGKTVEMSDKLRVWGLGNTVRGKDVHVYRPDIPLEERKLVASTLTQKVLREGKNTRYVKPSTLAKSLVEEFTGRKIFNDKANAAGNDNRYTCTNVIAAAYQDVANLKFNPNKTVGLVTPRDFVTSARTSRIASYLNPKRHDKLERRGVEEHERKKAAAVERSVASLRKGMKPGDIILLSPAPNETDPKKNPLGWAQETGLGLFNRALHGDKAHAAMYLGGDRVMDMRRNLEDKSLAKTLRKMDAKVLRVDMTPKERQVVTDRAKTFLSKKDQFAYSSPGWLVKFVASRSPAKRLVQGAANEELKRGRVICSNIVAQAYNGVADFNPDKPLGFISPKDLDTSQKTKEVAFYVNRKRWDAERRVWDTEHKTASAFEAFREKISLAGPPAHTHAKPPGEIEGMSATKWKQTAMDVPLVVLGTGVGYGLGRTAAEALGSHAASQAAGGAPPAWLKHLPLAGAVATSLGAYALGRSSHKLKERREQAEKAGRVIR